MRYADAFEAALNSIRDGIELETVLARHPEHAARLRQDLMLVLATRDYRDAVPQPAGEAAWSRLRLTLGSARGARAAPPKRRWRFARPALAAACAAVALVFVSTGILGFVPRDLEPAAIFRGPGEAGAATVEGVVLANEEGNLRVQTEEGVETLHVGTESVLAGEQGSMLDAAALEPGQLVSVRGERTAAGVVLVRRLELQAPASLRLWCVQNPARCEEARRLLDDAAARCETAAAACERLRQRIQDLTAELAGLGRLEEVLRRCEQSEGTACGELRAFCTANSDICAAVRDAILRRVAGDEAGRLRSLSDVCQAGDGAACRLLRQACAERPALCPSLPAGSQLSTPAPFQPSSQDAPHRPQSLEQDTPSSIQPIVTRVPARLASPQPLRDR